MNVFENKSKIIITCNKRLSYYLQQEVEALGFTVTRFKPVLNCWVPLMIASPLI
jgi:hypothetical protein